MNSTAAVLLHNTTLLYLDRYARYFTNLKNAALSSVTSLW